MEVTRIYKNSSEETLRIDSIIMKKTVSPNSYFVDQSNVTYKQEMVTNKIYESLDRVVADINIITDADEIVDYNPSVANNFNLVRWNVGLGYAVCNMSHLPQLGDTI